MLICNHSIRFDFSTFSDKIQENKRLKKSQPEIQMELKIPSMYIFTERLTNVVSPSNTFEQGVTMSDSMPVRAL